MQLINGFDRELYSLADAGTTKHLPLTTFHFTSMFLFSRRIRVQRQWVIKEAIKAARTEVGLTNRFPLETPATPERLVLTSSVCKLRFLP
ncbi:unnamed protein product [Arabis nemorensis]|uniref:Uncharacterized protein n=1 Tax=Arabis nemorensis TaxID=586526 RepID=A0A565CA13_9BRAS|nr:unnamed protein product [Arabis nemorensis]